MDTKLIEEIINIAGSQTALAEACTTEECVVKQPNVWNWLNRDKKIPAKHILQIERMCAEKGRPDIDRHLMMPDIFGERETTAA